ncbi:MAG: aldose 1-epimerase family protein [Vicinamibacterales bacterium]
MSAVNPEWIRLRSDALDVAVDPFGAQLSVLRDARGRDLLWDGDPSFWSGRAPILFPIVGGLNGDTYQWRGHTYSLAKHGFARRRRFDVVTAEPSAARFRLTPDEQSRTAYPFEFELDVTFVVSGASLTATARAVNTGPAVMPASLGFHPAFRWPLPDGSSRDSHVIQFERDEPAAMRQLDAAGLIAPHTVPTPIADARLRLCDELFEKDALIFDHIASRRVRYRSDAGPSLSVSFPDARYLGIWTKPHAGFVCIEPWRGIADAAGFAGEFDEKPGVVSVQPHDALTLTMVIEVHE